MQNVIDITDPAIFGSVVGVVGLTMVLVEVTKRSTVNVRWFQKVPVWIYSVLISSALTVLAKATGNLEGEWFDVIWQATTNAAIASGLYSWYSKSTNTPEDRKEGDDA